MRYLLLILISLFFCAGIIAQDEESVLKDGITIRPEVSFYNCGYALANGLKQYPLNMDADLAFEIADQIPDSFLLAVLSSEDVYPNRLLLVWPDIKKQRYYLSLLDYETLTNNGQGIPWAYYVMDLSQAAFHQWRDLEISEDLYQILAQMQRGAKELYPPDTGQYPYQWNYRGYYPNDNLYFFEGNSDCYQVRGIKCPEPEVPDSLLFTDNGLKTHPLAIYNRMFEKIISAVYHGAESEDIGQIIQTYQRVFYLPRGDAP